jgi:hypothetical protein
MLPKRVYYSFQACYLYRQKHMMQSPVYKLDVRAPAASLPMLTCVEAQKVKYEWSQNDRQNNHQSEQTQKLSKNGIR